MALLPVGRPRRLLLTAGVVIIVEHSALVQRLPRGRDSTQRRAEWFENRPQCPASSSVQRRRAMVRVCERLNAPPRGHDQATIVTPGSVVSGGDRTQCQSSVFRAGTRVNSPKL